MKRFKLSLTENPVFKSVTGLLNTTWNGTPTSGRAATEDQLAAAIASVTDNDHIAVVEAASGGNVSVSSSTSGDTTTYTVNTGETITGLTNTTWNGTPTSGRAATEDQLAALASTIETDTNTVTTVAGAGGIDVTDAGTDGNHAYTVKPGSQMTVGSTEQGSTDNSILIDGETGVVDGLTNTTWDTTPPQGGGPPNNPVSGRAATEDQLAAAIASLPADVNTITTVAAASGSTNVTVTDNGTGGNHAYVIAVDAAEEVEVVSIDNNIIVTVETV